MRSAGACRCSPGSALYVVASLGIVFVTSVEALTALRFVQGFAASAGMVLSMAIVRDRFEGIQVGKALARLMLVVGVAPEHRAADRRPVPAARVLAVHVRGAGRCSASSCWCWRSSCSRSRCRSQLRRSGGVGAAARSYGSLLRDPMFMGLALLSGFSMAALFTYVSSATFVFQEGFGLTAQQFAVIFASGAVAITAGTQINGAMIGRVRAGADPARRRCWPRWSITGSMVVVTLLGLGLWPLIALLVSNMLVTGHPAAGGSGDRARGQCPPGRQRGRAAGRHPVRCWRADRARHRAVRGGFGRGDGVGDVRREPGHGRDHVGDPAGHAPHQRGGTGAGSLGGTSSERSSRRSASPDLKPALAGTDPTGRPAQHCAGRPVLVRHP